MAYIIVGLNADKYVSAVRPYSKDLDIRAFLVSESGACELDFGTTVGWLAMYPENPSGFYNANKYTRLSAQDWQIENHSVQLLLEGIAKDTRIAKFTNLPVARNCSKPVLSAELTMLGIECVFGYVDHVVTPELLYTDGNVMPAGQRSMAEFMSIVFTHAYPQ